METAKTNKKHNVGRAGTKQIIQIQNYFKNLDVATIQDIFTQFNDVQMTIDHLTQVFPDEYTPDFGNEFSKEKGIRKLKDQTVRNVPVLQAYPHQVKHQPSRQNQKIDYMNKKYRNDACIEMRRKAHKLKESLNMCMVEYKNQQLDSAQGIDLHGLTKEEAMIVLEVCICRLQTMKSNGELPLVNGKYEFEVITGKGLHS